MNLLILSGNLTKDATTKNINDKTFINFSIAVNEGFGDNKKTMFVNCTLWGSEKIAAALTKGTKVMLKGKLNITKKDDTYYTTMLVDNFGGLEFTGSKKSNTENNVFEDTVFEESEPEDFGDMPF